MSGSISKSGPDVVVRGTLAAELTVPCARCLEHARVPVREELTVLAVPSSTMRTARGGPEHGAHGDLAEVAGDEADLLSYDGERLVLDDLVRDELLLGIPMIPLCSEGCPGIRPIPSHGEGGAPIDPRLAPLLRFKNKA